MKNLLYKDFKLVLHPSNCIFLAFPAMLLIPNYPAYIAFIYILLSVFFTFVTARENKDVFYTSLLPVKKTDAVKSRMLFVMIFELASVTISIPFAIIKMTLDGLPNLAGIEPNLAFYGFLFVMFAVFNSIFMVGFYKTAFKVGIPLVFAGTAVIIFFFLAEMLVWIPGPVSDFLDARDPETIINQWPLLLAGILVWIGSGRLTQTLASARFARVDV